MLPQLAALKEREELVKIAGQDLAVVLERIFEFAAKRAQQVRTYATGVWCLKEVFSEHFEDSIFSHNKQMPTTESPVEQWNRMLKECPEKLFIGHVLCPEIPPRRLVDCPDWQQYKSRQPNRAV